MCFFKTRVSHVATLLPLPSYLLVNTVIERSPKFWDRAFGEGEEN